jgi:hypothetical protein
MNDQYKDAFLWAWTGLFYIIGIFSLFRLKQTAHFFHNLRYSDRFGFRIFRWVGAAAIIIKGIQDIQVLSTKNH